MHELGLMRFKLPSVPKGGSTQAFLLACRVMGQKMKGEWWVLKAICIKHQKGNKTPLQSYIKIIRLICLRLLRGSNLIFQDFKKAENLFLRHCH